VNGQIKASIVDPHGHHLDDAVTRLKALADFAEKYGDSFYRIEALSELENSMRVLDMKIPEVRDAVRHESMSAVDFYDAAIAVDYDPTKH
jgi:type III restriction enzyme